MKHDSVGAWAEPEPLFSGEQEVGNEMCRLLSATLRATGASTALVFVLEDGCYIRQAATGSLRSSSVELLIAEKEASVPQVAFQLWPPAQGMPSLRVRARGRDLTCFAAASAFQRTGNKQGLLLILDELVDRRLSAAQSYVLEAQAAHCGTLLELNDVREFSRLETSAKSKQSQRLRLLESVAVHARDSIVITDAEPLDLPGPRILFCNAAFERATGYAPEEVIGKTPRILQGPETDPAARGKLRAAFSKWEAVEVELINYRKDGTPFWVELSIVPVADETGWFTHWVSVQRDITERKAAEALAMRMRITQIENEVLATEVSERKRVEAELTYTAFHDSLTRLRNRAFFMDRLGKAIQSTKDDPERGCAVLFLDLDRFKVVNDSLGHLAGDTLLKEIANRLTSCTRPQDTLARIGGDEFALLVEDVTNLATAIAAAERIIAATRPPVRLGRQEVFPGCSIGIVQTSARYDTPEALLRDADIAMYQAKRAGLGSYAVFDESMHATAVAKLQLQTDLRLAVERGEFEVVYQPIMALGENRVTGFEALLRWCQPDRGFVSPGEFIDVAEEIGLIRSIDRWVRWQACRQLKAWQTAWMRPDLCISVNASATEFADPAFLADLTALLRELDLAPSTIQIEITEGVFLNPTNNVMNAVEDIRRLGVRIALDDFGTGYSSLNYLNRYKIDTIKIDKSFVSGMSVNRRTSAVVELIVNLGRTLDIAIVAEGVEDATEAAILTSMGCTYGQGFFFARPLSSDKASQLINPHLVARSDC